MDKYGLIDVAQPKVHTSSNSSNGISNSKVHEDEDSVSAEVGVDNHEQLSDEILKNPAS